MKTLSITAANDLIDRAQAAGMAAGLGHTPSPMVVSGMGQTHTVSEGPCGFAWVNVKPANGQVAKLLVSRGMARRSEYEGGVTVWVTQFNQSWERKRAYAQAFASVLSQAGVRALAQDRLD